MKAERVPYGDVFLFAAPGGGAVHEAVFRVDGDDPYSRSTGTADATVDCWCNDHCDLLVVAGDDPERVVERVDATVGVRDRVVGDAATALVTDACLQRAASGTVDRHLAANDCLSVPPLRYVDGGKIVRVLALDPANLSGLYDDLRADHAVEVVSKVERDATGSSARGGPSIEGGRTAPPEGAIGGPQGRHPSGGAPVPSLSERQREAFRLAHDRGYYEIPREVTTAEIAAEMGLSRRTAEHHLRRAEAKLAAAFASVV